MDHKKAMNFQNFLAVGNVPNNQISFFIILGCVVSYYLTYLLKELNFRLSYFGTCLDSNIVKEVKKCCVFKYACTSKNNILFFKGLIL